MKTISLKFYLLIVIFITLLFYPSFCIYNNVKYVFNTTNKTVATFKSASYGKGIYTIYYMYQADGHDYQGSASKFLFVFGGDIKDKYTIVYLSNCNEKSTIQDFIIPNCIAWLLVFIVPLSALIIVIKQILCTINPKKVVSNYH